MWKVRAKRTVEKAFQQLIQLEEVEEVSGIMHGIDVILVVILVFLDMGGPLNPVLSE